MKINARVTELTRKLPINWHLLTICMDGYRRKPNQIFYNMGVVKIKGSLLSSIKFIFDN